MPSPALFAISVAFGLAVWGAVAWHYIWPALGDRPSPENLKPILLLHGFRFLGLAFVVPGVVSPELPATCSTSSLRRFHDRHSGFARPGYPGKPHGDRADLGFQYLRNCRPALRLLPGKPHITPGYPRLVRRWLFHPGGLRASSSHNPWLGVPNTVTSQGCRAVTEQSTYRLTQNGLWLGKKSWRDSWAPPTLSRLSM